MPPPPVWNRTAIALLDQLSSVLQETELNAPGTAAEKQVRAELTLVNLETAHRITSGPGLYAARFTLIESAVKYLNALTAGTPPPLLKGPTMRPNRAVRRVDHPYRVISPAGQPDTRFPPAE